MLFLPSISSFRENVSHDSSFVVSLNPNVNYSKSTRRKYKTSLKSIQPRFKFFQYRISGKWTRRSKDYLKFQYLKRKKYMTRSRVKQRIDSWRHDRWAISRSLTIIVLQWPHLVTRATSDTLNSVSSMNYFHSKLRCVLFSLIQINKKKLLLKRVKSSKSANFHKNKQRRFGRKWTLLSPLSNFPFKRRKFCWKVSPTRRQSYDLMIFVYKKMLRAYYLKEKKMRTVMSQFVTVFVIRNT